MNKETHVHYNTYLNIIIICSNINNDIYMEKDILCHLIGRALMPGTAVLLQVVPIAPCCTLCLRAAANGPI